MSRLSSLFQIQSGEGRLVAVMLVHSFCIGIARVFTRTTAYALFLVEFDAQALPYVYIGISATVTLLSFLYLKLSERLSLRKLLITCVSFLLLSLVGFRLGLRLTTARWLVFALPLWYEVLWTLTQLEFWNLAGCLFNVRQGKRLFGLIGAGEQVAVIISGLLTPALVALIGTANLLLAAVGAMAAVLGLLIYLSHPYATCLATAGEKTGTAAGASSSTSLFKNRYVLLIFGLFALAMVVYFATDNIFYAQAEIRYPAEDQLAGFIGVLLGAVGLLSLLSRVLLTSPLMDRLGVRGGLLFTPVVLLITGVLAATTGIAAGGAVFFWSVAALRLLNMVFFESIDVSLLNVIYQPLPAAQRVKTQAMVEGIVYSIAIGLAGLALWASTTLFTLEGGQLVYVLLVVLLGWIALGILLGREYPNQLVQALARRRLSGDQFSLVDGSTTAILQRELQSPYPEVVLYASNVLEAARPESLAGSLPALLDHPAPEVRSDALKRIERLGLTAEAAAIRQRLKQEPLPAVRGAAVRTLASLGETELFTEVSAFLQDPEPQVRRGAMVGLLRCGGIEGVLAAGQKLLEMAGSPEPAERVLAAQVLGEVGVGSFYQPLLALLLDRDLQVQRAALLAAGRLGNSKLWPLVLDKLLSSPTRRAAAAALVAGGESTLPALAAAFAQPEQPRKVLVQMARIGGRIGGEETVAWLKDQLAHPDPEVRTQVLNALSRCAYQARGEEAATVQEQIRAEVALSAERLAILNDVSEDEAAGLLRDALSEALSRARARIFLLLSLIYDRRSVLRARDNLTLASAEKRAYALEAVDVLVSKGLKRIILPLLADLPPSQQLQQLPPAFLPPRKDLKRRLQEIITDPAGQFDTWTRACALYAAGRLPVTALGGAVLATLSAPESLVRETAAWALAKLDAARYQRHVVALGNDPDPQVARIARQCQTDNRQEEIMLSTIEKVLVLKRVGIFAAMPDETLAEVAVLLEEVPLDGGQTIIEKGESGDCMYIIVDGEVRVHDGERTLNHLQAGDVFGEMALLDTEPRVASVTAVVDTQLLRLEQEPFYELLDEHSEVARGIIQVLSRHLRARVQDLRELRAHLEELERR